MARQTPMIVSLAIGICSWGCGQEPPDIVTLRSQLLGKTPDEVRHVLGEPSEIGHFDYGLPAIDTATPDEVAAWSAQTVAEDWSFDSCTVWFNVNGLVVHIGPSQDAIEELNEMFTGKTDQEVRQTLGEPQATEERESLVPGEPPRMLWHYDGFLIVIGGDAKVICADGSPNPP